MKARQSFAFFLGVFFPWVLCGADADLSVTQILDPEPAIWGSQVVYRITVENHGPDAATDVTLTDDLPPGATFVGADNGGSYDGVVHRVTWLLGTLQNGEVLEIELVLNPGFDASSSNIDLFFSGRRFDNDALSVFRLSSGLVDPLLSPTADDLLGVAFADDASLLVCDPGDLSLSDAGAPRNDGRIIAVVGAGTVFSQGGLLTNPTALVRHADHHVYVVEPESARDDGQGGLGADTSGRVIQIDEMGNQSLFAEGGNLVDPIDVTVDGSGHLLVLNRSGSLLRLDPFAAGQSVVSSAGLLSQPAALAFDCANSAYVVDLNEGLLRIDLTTGAQSLVKAKDTGSGFFGFYDVVYLFNGRVFVSARNNGGSGSLFLLDGSGSVEQTFQGGAGSNFQNPTGMVPSHFLISETMVSTSAVDPDPNNNRFPYAVEVHKPEPDVLHIVVSEGIGLTDSPSVVPAAMVSVTETLALTDQVNPSAALQVTVSESVTLGDSSSVEAAVQVTVSETVALGNQASGVTESGAPTIENVFMFGPRFVLEDEAKVVHGGAWLGVVFSEAMQNRPGAGDPDDVDNGMNYLLVSPGLDAAFQTEGCVDGAQGDDVAATFETVFYDASRQTMALLWPQPQRPGTGPFRLFLCAEGRLMDLEGLSLDGDGDGNEGGEFALEFELLSRNLLRNSHFDEGVSDWVPEIPGSGSFSFDGFDVDLFARSGSARIDLEGAGVAEISQCVELEGAAWLSLTGEVSVTGRPGAHVDISAEMRMFEGAGCEGVQLESRIMSVPVQTTQQTWTTLRGTVPVFEGSSSLLLSLEVESQVAESMTTFFDSIVIQRDSGLLSGESFEDGSLGVFELNRQK